MPGGSHMTFDPLCASVARVFHSWKGLATGWTLGVLWLGTRVHAMAKFTTHAANLHRSAKWSALEEDTAHLYMERPMVFLENEKHRVGVTLESSVDEGLPVSLEIVIEVAVHNGCFQAVNDPSAGGGWRLHVRGKFA